jgi:hypothetical protein
MAVGALRDTCAHALIGTALPSFSATVDEDRLRRFVHAIGERRAEHLDVAAARAAGYPKLPVPPTYLFALEFERPEPYLAVEALGASLSAVLQAEQAFDYRQVCYAGDRLDFAPVVADYLEKSGGRLGFLTRRTDVTRDGKVVAILENVVAIRWSA